MIADSFATFDPAQLGEDFRIAFAALQKMNGETPVGRHDISDRVYINVMEYDASEPWNPAELEAHKEYADIQVVLSGKEAVAWTFNEGLPVTREYNAESDVLFQKADPSAVSKLELVPGLFVVEVELISTAKNDYDYVVFQDAMPSGFEYVNPASGWMWQWSSPMYAEYKERGAKFYLRNMARGKSNAFYRIRAQLCGKVTALPAKGYGIYAPELKCNSAQQMLQTEAAK